jgi:DNA-binding GntR family transcriptional regulator
MTLPEPSRALVDETAARLEQAILSGELAPGQKLSEQALSSQYGVSRGPLREAIRSLEGRRLVTRTPFSGVCVVQLSIDDIEQLLLTREALEGMACRQAAECMTLHETRRLRTCLEAIGKRFLKDGLGGVFRKGTADNDLHVQIAVGSRNRWLADIICREVYPLLQICRLHIPAVREQVREREKAIFPEHEAIIVAIEQRNPEAAERLMRAHLAASRESFMSHLRRSHPEEDGTSKRNVRVS